MDLPVVETVIWIFCTFNITKALHRHRLDIWLSTWTWIICWIVVLKMSRKTLIYTDIIDMYYKLCKQVSFMINKLYMYIQIVHCNNHIIWQDLFVIFSCAQYFKQLYLHTQYNILFIMIFFTKTNKLKIVYKVFEKE